MPRPIPRPISGRRFAPKIRMMIARMISSSGMPRRPISLSGRPSFWVDCVHSGRHVKRTDYRVHVLNHLCQRRPMAKLILSATAGAAAIAGAVALLELTPAAHAQAAGLQRESSIAQFSSQVELVEV